MKKLKIVLPFIITSITLVIIYFTIYRDVQLMGGLRIQYDSKEILHKAELFLQDYNIRTDNLQKNCSLQSNLGLIRQVQCVYGYKKGNELLRTSLPGYFWKVTWSKTPKSNLSFGVTSAENQTDNSIIMVSYDTKGNLIEFSIAENDSDEIPSASIGEVRDVVKKFNSRLFKIEKKEQPENPADTITPVKYSLISNDSDELNFQSEKKILHTHRIDYVYTWRGISGFMDDSINVDVTLSGNMISAYKLSYVIPDKYTVIDSDLFQDIIIVVFYLVIIILLGVVAYKKIKAYEIGFRLAFIVSLIAAITLGINFYLINNDQAGWNILFPIVMAGVFYGGFVLIAWAAGETVSREVWKDKFYSIDLITKGYFLNTRIGVSVLNGLTTGFALIIIQLLFLLIAQNFTAVTCTSYQYVLFDSLNSQSPSFEIITKSVFYPICLAAIFLSFIVSGLRKRINSAVVLILAAGIIWGLVNTSDIYPHYISIIWRMLLGVIMVWIYYKYDLLTSMCSLTIFFITLEGLALLNTGHVSYSSSAHSLLVFLVLIILYGCTAILSKDKILDLDDITPSFARNITERERLQRELEIAKEVQLSFLPRTNPQFPGLEIACRCVPALEVGGDYYDFVISEDKKIGIIIGDVSGKGTQAAFYITLTKGFLKALTRIAYTPANFLTELNSLFYENVERGTFISMVYGVIDLENKNIKIARAGHNPVIVKNSLKGFTEFLNSSGMALGLEKGPIFNRSIKEVEVPFSSGDIFVFYTDGFTEAMNKLNEEFGENRLVSSVEDNSMLHAKQILDNILKEVHNFMGKAVQHDDMTMVVVKVI